MPTISIIMPVKNAEKWIRDTIRSVIDQSFSDWELLCIDDHSTDGSFDHIKELSQSDSRIKMFMNRGTGIIPALHLGLENSSGESITRMDADDIMPVNRLDKLKELLSTIPERGIATGKVEYFAEEVVSQGYQKYERWLNDRIDNGDHWEQIYRECAIASPNWLVRKNDLIEYGIFEQLEYPEDYSMCFLWLANHFNVISTSETTLMWREHPERTSRNSDTYQQASFFQLKLKWFQKLNPTGSIGLLGAGPKGKLTASHFNSTKRDFSWYDLNHKNYNATINGVAVKDYDLLQEDLVLIAVYPENRKELEDFLEKKNYRIGKNAWYL